MSGTYRGRTLAWKDNTPTDELMEWTAYDEVLLSMQLEPEGRNNETGFRIFRRNVTGKKTWDGTLSDYRQMGEVAADVTTWFDNDVLPAGAYSYVVTAYHVRSGNSLPRTEARIVHQVGILKPAAAVEPLGAAPNPFNPNTTLTFQLLQEGPVQLAIYNAAGQVVEVLEDQTLDAGVHDRTWNAADHASGIYLYRLEADGKVQLGKLALIR